MNKQAVIRQILAALESELAVLTRAAQSAFAAATDPGSKAENKYDTRTLEASYVARGQALRVEELQEAVHAFRALPAHSPQGDAAVQLGALVAVRLPGETAHFFIGPAAGGTAVMLEGQEITVVTPAAPLGQKLLGRRAGDVFDLHPGAQAQVMEVA